MQKEKTEMTTFQSLVKKECLHIVRDSRTMVITLVMPLVLLLLFGFAISMEVRDIRIVAVVENFTDETRDLLQQIEVNDYFKFKGITQSKKVEELLRRGDIDAALYVRNNDGKLIYQIVVDASNPTTAKAMSAYIQGVINNRQKTTPVLTSTLYNPQMKSAYNFVPGIMGMIFILICAIMTSVSIVREKETGTMNLLLVSPIRPGTIIMGKLVPYLMLSCIILFLMLLISYTVLGLPLSMSILNVIFVSLIYVALSLSLGLLVSTLVQLQLAALIVSAMILMLPIVMLSGMIFPIVNMPVVLQWFSYIIPARWYIEAMRKLMIQQLDLIFISKEIMILTSMTMVLLLLAIKKFTSTQK